MIRTLLHRLVLPLLLLLATMPPVMAAEPFAEDELLLLELNMQRHVLSDTLPAYRRGDSLLLSLSGLVSGLALAIEVDAAAGRAEGWFIDESRHFSLRMTGAEGLVVVDGASLPVAASALLLRDDDIFVDYHSFSSWLPVDLVVDMPNLAVSAIARETLPIQQRIRRMSRKPSALPSLYQPTMTPREDPYQLFSTPHADLTINSTVSRIKASGDTNRFTNYSLIAGGDMAFMTSQLYLGGTSNDRLTQARLLLERGDHRGELLGPMSASRVQLGDLSAPTLPLMRSTPAERGVLIERSVLATSYDFDQVDLSGTQEPGWEVELYWNDSLIDRQEVGEDGRYLFTAVPLYYGDNRFELVFYGPNGEERREKRSYNVGHGMQKAGRFDYQLVYTEKGRSLFAEGENITPPSNQGTERLNARLTLGLGGGLAVGAGMHSVEFNDARHEYDYYELRSTLSGLAMTLRTMHDSEGGDIHEAVLQSTIGRLALRGNYSVYDGMVLEGEELLTDRRLSEGKLALTGRLERSALSLSYQDTRYQQSSRRILANYFSIPLKQMNLSNSLAFQRDETLLGVDDTLSGSLQMSTYGYPLQWRLRSSYELSPTTRLAELFASANLRIDSRMRMYFELNYVPETAFSRYKAGMSWRLKEALVTPSLAYDSNGNYYGYFNLSFGLGPNARGDGVRMSSERLSSNGSAAVRFFADENANGIADEGERPVPGVSMRLMPGGRQAVSDADGYLMMERLGPYQPVDLLVARETISDVDLAPLEDGIGLVPRPGRLQRVEFPLQRMAEVEGTLYAEGASGRVTLSGVELWLEDRGGREVKRIRSGYDGFYLFSEVPMGRYRLRVAEGYRLLSPEGAEELLIDGERWVISGHDLMLERPLAERRTTDVEALPVISLGAGVLATTPPPVEPELLPEPEPVPVPVLVGDSGVQLAAYRDRAAALAARARLMQRHADLLKGLKFELHRADLGARGVFQRLIVGPMPRDRAAALCDRLKAREQGCFLVTLP